MTLAAIYIHEHFLFDKPEVINFGGEKKYHFEFDENKNAITITTVLNDYYIPDFFGEKIANISAVVGANGTGKTTLMSIINKYKDDAKALFIYDDGTEIPIVENRTGRRDDNGRPTSENQLFVYYEKNELTSIARDDISKLYYTSIPDIELDNFSSALNINPQRNQTLDDYHFEKIEKNVMFLSSELSIDLKKKNNEIPLYDKLFISAKPLSKRDLRNTYGGFEVEGDIESTQKLNLDDLWKTYTVRDENKTHLTNDGLDFFSNLEVNILSYVLIDATSMQTEYNGRPDTTFEEFIKKKDFEDKLIDFLNHKIAFIDRYIYLRIKNEIDALNFTVCLTLIDDIDINAELDEKEDRVVRRLDKILKTSTSLAKPKDNVGVLFKQLESLVNDELNSNEFKHFRDGIQEVLKRLNTPTSVTIESINREILSSIKEIKKGIELTFKALRENRKEIKTQITGKAKQAIKLFTKINSFYKAMTIVITRDGFNLDKGVLSLDLQTLKFTEFKELMQAYRLMISAFNENSVINAQVLQFTPSKRLSFGEKSLLNLFSSFYGFTLNKYNHLRRKKNHILLLDEADLGFHPLWKRRYVSYLINVLPDIFANLFVMLETHSTMEEAEAENISPTIQIIFATHDPLALSDIPNDNVTYLRKGDNNKSKILSDIADDERPSNSFGANISDLLSHSFFVDNGLVGDFASKKINETIAWINYKNGHEYDESVKFEDEPDYHKKLIELVDEPIVKHKLRQMYIEATNDKEAIENEINRLRKKIKQK
ncbi:OLD family protein [Spongiimicrobium salis]|uniref:hypothetical protein n=1 Tax=Spongiimicrobium salis TaxID=1667022 RepID=UPI00374DDE6A